MSSNEWNWAGNLEYSASVIHRPETLADIQDLVRTRPSLKALGSRHSFNRIADTNGELISSERMTSILQFSPEQLTVKVQPGIKYGELGRFLDSKGFALSNLASLPHISVGGACATATHGSGVENGNLSTSVVGIEFIDGRGNLVEMTPEKDGDRFYGAIVHLGALGFVVSLTLCLVPSFLVSQFVFEGLPFDSLEANFDAITRSGYSVSLFSFWNSDEVAQIWVKTRSPLLLDFKGLGATPADGQRSPIPGAPVENCTQQLGEPGPWIDRLAHFRMGFTPSSGEELQSEFFVPREFAWEALSEINLLRDRIAPHIHTSEIRCIAKDAIWMSPNYDRESVAIHFTWKQNWKEVEKLLGVIESKLARFNARPHWGKLFTMKKEKIQTLYPRYSDFLALRREFDPEAKFSNDFLAETIG